MQTNKVFVNLIVIRQNGHSDPTWITTNRLAEYEMIIFMK
jgi:hypothetical protein